MCAAVARGVGMPRVLFFGQVDEHWVLVSELLGPTLEDLVQFCHDPALIVPNVLSVKTVLLIAIEAVARVKYIHSKGILHRDLRPDNLLMGTGNKGNILYVIDFGLATEFPPAEIPEPTDGKDVAPILFAGTIAYASARNHLHKQQGWADDLEGLAYVFRRLLRGNLPWDDGYRDYSDKEASLKIGEAKNAITGEQLFEGFPDVFAKYYNYVRRLAFDERPNYVYLTNLFRNAYARQRYKHDKVFDWTEKIYNSVRDI
ncbi:uncharacterized protein DNG_09886 [Cephalotrichum gorgonifer]|uniref:EKC/KEOPS complex subunit BUD32 n=1 Tax=Cephalotrichum gorgonifer TaxID=2041049 RepID=A0AAE8N6P6_9PEZI|nr:uncharacterized protein DNG_09886 [Cephalotrichum gorgonifer]